MAHPPILDPMPDWLECDSAYCREEAPDLGFNSQPTDALGHFRWLLDWDLSTLLIIIEGREKRC